MISLSSATSNGEIDAGLRTKRLCLSADELNELSSEQFIEKWHLQNIYIDQLEAQIAKSNSSHLNSAKSSFEFSRREFEDKLKHQQLEATRKENILIMKLTMKDQEMQLLMVSSRDQQCY